MYQALYRTWRPDKFESVCGQDAVIRTLRNQVISGHISHAYLFCGSRGTGKTTTAKLFARAINCLNPKDGEPCGECASCRSIQEESSLDVLEIDAASNNGVDEIRALRDSIAYPPTVGSHKVYIVDEVHQLSGGAFNALLKTLEEPPSHAVFILATTEPNRLPATVLSRCQRYDFKRISMKNIIARLEVVLKGIGRSCTNEALEEIASAADGALRDALSLLDMCLGYTDDVVDAPLVRDVLGTGGRSFTFDLTDALEACDARAALSLINNAVQEGRDPAVLSREIAEHLRIILMAKSFGASVEDLAQLTAETAARFCEQAEKFEEKRLIRTMDMFMRAESDMKYTYMPRTVLEMCAVRACDISREKSVDGVTERVEALEKRLREGVTLRERPAAASAAPAKAEPKKEKPIQKPAAEPVSAPDDGAAAYAEGVESFMKQNPQYRVFLGNARYLRTDGDDVYVRYAKDQLIQKLTVEKKTAEIEEALEKTYGRKVHLIITMEDGGRAATNANGTGLSRTYEIFGRENVELVD